MVSHSRAAKGLGSSCLLCLPGAHRRGYTRRLPRAPGRKTRGFRCHVPMDTGVSVDEVVLADSLLAKRPYFPPKEML